MDQKTAAQVLDRLQEEYPDARCALDHENVFQLLVSTMLSAQTTDKRVNMVAPALYEAFPDAASLAEADREQVEDCIRSIGLYKNKAKNIIAMARKLEEEFGGQVPADRKLLMSLPGVGQKTANVVLADGFGEQRIAVDTHVFRVANRIGLAHAEDVKKTEEQLIRILPPDRLTDAHHAIIFHGRQCCPARKPACGRCCVRNFCERNGL